MGFAILEAVGKTLTPTLVPIDKDGFIYRTGQVLRVTSLPNRYTNYALNNPQSHTQVQHYCHATKSVGIDRAIWKS